MAQKIRVADYIAQTLVRHGIQKVFLVTGGGAMHLNDAIGRSPQLEWVCCHHEQAGAMAAESYARLSGQMAALNVTTGPGGTNAITGVYGAYVDSIPMLILSGQVKWETLVRSTGLPLRQLGDQEVDIIAVVKPITKMAEIVTDPLMIRYELERAIHLAKTGRPGPCWLDIPMNVQGAMVDPSLLRGYDPSEDTCARADQPTSDVKESSKIILEKLREAKRPVILAGSGIRLSHSHAKFLQLADQLGIPVTTAWNAHDVIWNSHPTYVGRPGTIGDRAGNFAVQNSDFLLVLGCRLNIRQISYNWAAFARAAYQVIVDTDESELKKPTLRPNLAVHANVKEVIEELIKLDPQGPSAEQKAWLNWCLERRERYPVVLPEYWKSEKNINPYCFVDTLFKNLGEDEVIVTGDGTACVVTFQAAQLKKGQRLFTNSGCASMGYDLPAAVGAYYGGIKAYGKLNRVICLAGDGSIQMNLQELQTIVTHKIPAKIFILNNTGYHSIRQTQQNYFPDNIIGCGAESGLGFPDFGKLAFAYGIPFRKVQQLTEMNQLIEETLRAPGPQICEILLDLNQQFAPKLSSKKHPDGRMISAPLEDLFPFLPREELKSNMLIPLLDED